MNRSSLKYVKEKLNNNRAKKRFGQNFLIDENISKKIVNIASDKNTKTLEIGPGLGALSELLLLNSKSLEAFEIDKDLYNVLKEEIINDNFKIHNVDFLDVDLKEYENEPLNIVSNLPYYVTTPILFKLFNSKLNINKITVMIQKEVASRLTAKPKTKDYNALSVIVSYLFDVNYEFTVNKTSFYPSPDVSSAVVSFTYKVKRDFDYEAKLFELIKESFKMKRKTLYNNLKEYLDKDKITEIYNKLKFSDSIRAEELTLDDYINIYNIVYED